jgi:hypothetical protein
VLQKPLDACVHGSESESFNLMALYHMGEKNEKSLGTALNLKRIKTLSFLSTTLGQVQ